MSTDTPVPTTEEPKVTAAAPTQPPPTTDAPATAQPTTAKEPAPGNKPSKKGRGVILDIALVLLLLGILGAAAYYVHDTMTRYHVPTPMELAMEENKQLSERYEKLFHQANIADEQIHLRQRLVQLEGQLSKNSRLISDKKAAIDEQHGRVLALQYSIRQADATNRSIARSLLPGMRVGDVRTTDDDLYRNATIRSIDFKRKLIALRYPQGQVRFPLRELVKDTLPELARYALNDLDLVDMADFEHTESEPAAETAKPRPAAKPKKPAVTATETDYDPTGAPVLDTEANRTSTTNVPDESTPAPTTDVWDVPSGDLPM